MSYTPQSPAGRTIPLDEPMPAQIGWPRTSCASGACTRPVAN
jgi:hypothetical protein